MSPSTHTPSRGIGTPGKSRVPPYSTVEGPGEKRTNFLQNCTPYTNDSKRVALQVLPWLRTGSK